MNEELPHRARVAWPQSPIIEGSLRTLTREEYLSEFGPKFDRIGPDYGRWFSPVVEGRPYSFEARAIRPQSADDLYTQMDFAPDSLPPGWKFQVSEVAEGLGHPGGAMQFQVMDESGAFVSMSDLLKAGKASTW